MAATSKLSLLTLLLYVICFAAAGCYLDCRDIKDTATIEKKCVFSGIYMIKPQRDMPAFKVYCDMETDGGGWTVFQRRMDGSVDFYRKWIDYKYGFGSLEGEFWLGLDKIYRLTQIGSCLRVDMEDFGNTRKYAKYNKFHVGDSAALYKLTVGGYTGNAGDSLTIPHSGMNFTTQDNDNDSDAVNNCAIQYNGAWWYKACHESNLNGLYLKGPAKTYGNGVVWLAFKNNYHYSLKSTELKMKRC